MGVQHHSAVKNLTVERLVRLPDDPGPSFPGVLACTFGAWLRLAQRLRPALSWYHFLIVFGVATHGLAELWTDRPASRLTNIKGGPTIVVSFPSSAHSISYFAIHPSQSSIIPSLSTLLPSNTMSSFAATTASDPEFPLPEETARIGALLRPVSLTVKLVVNLTAEVPRMAPSPNRPPSPTWADVLRNPAPNQNSPLFRPVVPNTPPGLRMVMDLPEPEVPPFVLGQAALDDIFMYLQGNDAVADPEPEVPPVPIVPDAEPAGFEPSQTAIHWADHRHTSISSDHSDSKSSRPSTADTTESNSYQ
ncbi:hypothetical protein KEM48_008179 [Puccinia striiformis f. sp. tritici PST-130]|nr:hypothetical protein KEM48_008179 [Puccinia striiformis f. sp. tritici PST-130]